MGLKTRVIPILLWDEHGAVKGRQFNPGRRIGAISDRVRLLERRNIDELIILDIAATPHGRAPRLNEVRRLCSDLFMPVTVGGGVKTLEDIRGLLAAGADKIAIKTAAAPELISAASRKFGAQAIVVSIDVDGEPYPIEWAQQVERCGAGEILLQDINRDGMMAGYNLDLIRAVSGAVEIPVIAAGGCGSYQHMVEALRAGAHAVAAGAMFQFTETTPKEAARYLNANGHPARL